MSLTVRIADERFDELFLEFLEITESSTGTPRSFEGFRAGYAAQHEGYKQRLHEIARARLRAEFWKRDDIGSGRIVRHAIDAIEITGSPAPNNLLEWQPKRGPEKVSHRRLLEARDSPGRLPEVEEALYDHFVGEADPAHCFARLVELLGKHYDLLAYVFFLRDPSQFMPVRPRHFSRAFGRLGVPHVMERHCSWENYLGFLGRLGEVLRHLERRRVPDLAGLIDAHSFCWILATSGSLGMARRSEADDAVYLAGKAGAAPSWTGASGEARPLSEEELELVLARQREAGLRAQEVVVERERRRLREAGRDDLAEIVRDVSRENVAAGYDIESYYPDGRRRIIEVKSITARASDLCFYVSRNELQVGRETEGYVYVLVLFRVSGAHRIFELDGTDLPDEALRPVQYEVSLDSRARRDGGSGGKGHRVLRNRA